MHVHTSLQTKNKVYETAPATLHGQHHETGSNLGWHDHVAHKAHALVQEQGHIQHGTGHGLGCQLQLSS